MNDRNENLSNRPVAKDTKKEAAKTGTGAVAGGVLGGVAGGATAGALAGGMTGPVGAAVGAAVGAVIGAVAGHKADPKVEDTYWRDNYNTRPYVSQGSTYEDYGPAYTHGVNAYNQYPERHFDDLEPQMRTDWDRSRGTSRLEWDHARPAARDAWDRVKNAGERVIPGDSDGDGR